mgnify:FL=1|tara:strand:- start:293 stop:919 length:627 start_codon:yes stop_codon:yes gene_type:complete
MVNEREMAGLTNSLHIPLIIQDILYGRESVSDEVKHALHEEISDLRTDSALLAIALAGQKIATKYKNFGAAMAVLNMECERIISDYAAEWMASSQGGLSGEDETLSKMVYLPEDLQALADLFESSMNALQRRVPEAAALCNILKTQAEAHMLIAECYVDAMDLDDASMILANEFYFSQEAANVSKNSYAETTLDGNVVVFPTVSKTKN